jgi:type II secretory pathway component HofQ
MGKSISVSRIILTLSAALLFPSVVQTVVGPHSNLPWPQSSLVNAASAQEALSAADPWQRHVSIELHDADVEVALRIVAEMTNTNIVLAQGVSGRIRNLRVMDVPVKQLFEIILRLRALYAQQEGNVIIVYPLETFADEMKKRQG